MTWISFLHYGTRNGYKKQTVVLQTGGRGWREHLCAHHLVIFQVGTHEFSMRLLFYFSSGARVDSDTNGSAPHLAESWLTCHLVGFSDPKAFQSYSRLLLPDGRLDTCAQGGAFVLHQEDVWSNSLVELILGGLAIVLIITLCTCT